VNKREEELPRLGVIGESQPPQCGGGEGRGQVQGIQKKRKGSTKRGKQVPGGKASGKSAGGKRNPGERKGGDDMEEHCRGCTGGGKVMGTGRWGRGMV